MIPPIALTCGDPNGIGIDIALQAAAKISDVPFFLIADKGHVSQRCQQTAVMEIFDVDDVQNVPNGILPVLHHEFPHPALLNGEQPNNANAIIDVIKRAVKMVQNGTASAICTNPIHKKVLKDGAKFAFPGHTELLAHIGNVDQSVMMLLCDQLRVVPVTIHVAIDEVPKLLTQDLLRETILITHTALMRDFKTPNPRIALAGLNPHAGEDGTFGTEEIRTIKPVADELRSIGINITNPLSADTMFHSDARKTYDVAICMYHDQALIPIKTLDFHGGVNTTLGLPFIRTSPDHGTAFDLAGTGKANPSSLIAALKCADKMVKARASHED